MPARLVNNMYQSLIGKVQPIEKLEKEIKRFEFQSIIGKVQQYVKRVIRESC